MVFNVSLLIKQVKHKEDNPDIKRHFLLSNYVLRSALKGDFCDLIKKNGYGNDAQILRTEKHLVRFIKHNYGTGEFTLQHCKGGRTGSPMFWHGRIEQDRFIRYKGSITPYLFSMSPINRWHEL